MYLPTLFLYALAVMIDQYHHHSCRKSALIAPLQAHWGRLSFWFVNAGERYITVDQLETA